MRIPRPAAEKLGVDRQDPDLDGLLLGLIRRATGGKVTSTRRAPVALRATGAGRGLEGLAEPTKELCLHNTFGVGRIWKVLVAEHSSAI